jgi:negative elongation factor C/D
MHLVLLDEIVQNHSILHDRVLNLLIKLFLTSFPDLDNLIQVNSERNVLINSYELFLYICLKIQLKKTIIDRMIYLMSRGHVIPVVAFLNKCWKEQDTDISLIRHFVMEVNINTLNFIRIFIIVFLFQRFWK